MSENKSEKKILYLECATGISGDMTVAALLDLGADREGLEKTLKGLNVDGYEIKISNTSRNGMAGVDFDVVLEDNKYGHKHHHHHHGHDHDHHHEHKHEHHHAHHEHRNIGDIMRIIDGAELTERTAAIARRTFEIIAEAEAKAHGIPVEDVHFHEVGAIDSIVDIVSAAYCFDNLGIYEVIVPALNEGSGTIMCQHGALPVPVPAVANITAKHGIAMRITDVTTEMVTPTGAALVAAVRTSDKLPESFTIDRVGVGLGKRDLGRPNMLRAMLIVPGLAEGRKKLMGEDSLVMLETNMDDCTGEQMGLAMERLMDAGALDAHYIPCFMKKNRPGYMLGVICRANDVPALEDVIFRNTTTIGIRRTPFERTELEREQIEVELPYGKVAVKKCHWRGENFFYPEYESVKSLSEATGKVFGDVYAEAKAKANTGR